jgi:hypothetical protein
VAIRCVTAEEETRAVGVVKETIAHDHVVAVSLEVEGLTITTSQANGDEAPFTVLEDPVLASKEHRASHAVEGTKTTSNIEGDAVSHDSGVNTTNTLLPLKPLLEEATVENQVLEIVDIRGILVEIIGTVGPEPGGQPPKDAVLERDIRHHDALVPLMRKKAHAKTDLTLGIIFVMLVLQGIMKVAVFDPEVLSGFAIVRIVRVNPRHAPIELDSHDFEPALVGKANARTVLVVILPINYRFRTHAVS